MWRTRDEAGAMLCRENCPSSQLFMKTPLSRLAPAGRIFMAFLEPCSWGRGISLYSKTGTSETAFSVRVVSLLACFFLPTSSNQAISRPAGPHPKSTLLPFLTLPCADVGKREPRPGQLFAITLPELQLWGRARLSERDS